VHGADRRVQMPKLSRLSFLAPEWTRFVRGSTKPLALLANPRHWSSLWYQGIARQGESND
jgi:hypothetical protein